MLIMEDQRLDKYGKKEVMGHIVGPIVIAVIFFLIAGTIKLPRAWIWAVLNLVFYTAGMLLVYFLNPVLLNARGSWNIKKDAKHWDRIMLQIFGTVGLYGHTTIMALDAGRFNWSHMEDWTLIPGLILFTFGFFMVYWAMIMNPHFETIVRIQHDRNHKVISRGPYRILRHPGYLGLIITNFGSTLIVGSKFGFITAVATLLILVTRTLLEDRDLQSELAGYKEYAQKIRYRLIPYIW